MASGSLLASRVSDVEEKSMWIEWGNLGRDNNACSLGSGFPDFPLHPYLQEQLSIAASVPQNNWYTKSRGHPRLLQEILADYTKLLNRNLDESEILVTVGAYQGIFWIFQCFVEEGDEVIVFNPTFNAYKVANKITKGTIVPVPLKIEPQGWVLDKDNLAKSFSEKTKMVVLNTPHNPTGKCFTREELVYIGELCKKYDCIVMADEVYDRYTLGDNEHVRIASLPGMWERTITLYSAGKMFGITGWRVGWAIGPAEYMKVMNGICLVATFGCPTLLQEALAGMLERERTCLPSDSYYTWADGVFRDNHTKLSIAFNKVNMPVLPCEGGFFLVVDCSKRRFTFQDTDEYKNCTEPMDVKIAKELTKRFKLLVLPLSLFYNPELNDIPTKYLRVCYAKCPETVDRAVKIIDTFE